VASIEEGKVLRIAGAQDLTSETTAVTRGQPGIEIIMTKNRLAKSKARDLQTTTGGTYAASIAEIRKVYDGCLWMLVRIPATSIVGPSDTDLSRPSFIKSAPDTWNTIGATDILTDADIAQVMADNQWGKTYRIVFTGTKSLRNYDKVKHAGILAELADEAELAGAGTLTPASLRARAETVTAMLDVNLDNPDADLSLDRMRASAQGNGDRSADQPHLDGTFAAPSASAILTMKAAVRTLAENRGDALTDSTMKALELLGGFIGRTERYTREAEAKEAARIEKRALAAS
jgi:hypothetical protein